MADTPEDVLKIGIDISEVERQMPIFMEKLKESGVVFDELSVKSLQFNARQEVIGVTMKGVANSIENSTVAFKTYKEAILDAEGAVVGFTEAQNRLKTVGFGSTAAEAEMKKQQELMKVKLDFQKQIEEGAKRAQGMDDDAIKQNLQQQEQKRNIFKQMFSDQEKHKASLTQETEEITKQQKEVGILGNFWERVSSIMVGLVIYRGLTAGATAIGSSVADAMEFEKRISEIRTISQDSQKSFGDWTKEVRNLSDAFGDTAKNVAEGTYQALSNQVVDSTTSFQFMAEAMKFGAVTMATTQDSVSLLSSAINAFGFKASDTEKVAAGLFQVIAGGRVRASELKDTFGPTALIAHELGLSFNDLGATIESMGLQGIEADNVMNYTRNLMLALVKPTKDMAGLFNEWGVSSGQAAIQAFGWTGVLAKINDEANKGGSERLGELFKNIRGLQGALAETGTGFNNFLRDIDKLSSENALSAYSNASAIAFESNGKKLEIEFNKIKNFFLVDIGESIVKVLADFSEHIGGMANAVKVLAEAVVIGTAAWVAYNTAMFFFGGASGSVMINFFDNMYLMVIRSGQALEGLAALLSSEAFLLAGPIAAVVAYGAYVYLTTKSIKEDFDDALNYKDARVEDSTKRAETEIDKETDATIKGIDIRYQALYKSLAEGQSLYHQSAQNTKQIYKDLDDSLKLIAASHNDFIKATMDDLKNSVRAAEADIKASVKFVESLKADSDKTMFNFGLEGKTDSNKIKAIIEKANQLGKQANAIKDDDSKATEYRDIVKEQISLMKEAMQIAQKSAGEQVRDGEKLVTIAEKEKEIKERMAQDAIHAQEKLNDLEIKRGQDIENTHLKEERAGMTRNNANLATGKGAGRTQIKAQGNFNESIKADEIHLGQELSNINEQELKVKQELAEKNKKNAEELAKVHDQETKFKEKSSETNKVYSERNEIAKSFLKIQEDVAKVESDRQKREEELINKKKAEEATLKGNQEHLLQLYKEIESFDPKNKKGSKIDVADFDKKKQEIIGLEAASGLTVGERITLMDKMEEKAKQIAEMMHDAFKSDEAKQLGDEVSKMKKQLEEVIKVKGETQKTLLEVTKTDLEKAIGVAKALDTDMKTGRAFTTGGVSGIPDTPNLDKINSIDNVKNNDDKIRQLIQMKNDATQAGTVSTSAGGISSDDAAKITGKAQELGMLIEALRASSVKLDENKSEIDKANDEYSHLTNTIIDITPKTVDVLVNSYADLKSRIDAFQQQSIQDNLMSAKFNDGSNWMPGMADGGSVKKGRDSVHAMLAPGEFVVNAAASRKHYSSLIAMNSGFSPRHYNQGGSVTNTVGEINVNVTGNGTTQSSIREFAKGLRREIRRGGISLE